MAGARGAWTRRDCWRRAAKHNLPRSQCRELRHSYRPILITVVLVQALLRAAAEPVKVPGGNFPANLSRSPARSRTSGDRDALGPGHVSLRTRHLTGLAEGVEDDV